MIKNIIERALYVGLLFSLIALVGVVAVMLAYPTLALIKIAPVAGYVTVVAVEVTLAVKTVRDLKKEGMVYVIAGVIYALAVVVLL